jgi:hypothetical protein
LDSAADFLLGGLPKLWNPEVDGCTRLGLKRGMIGMFEGITSSYFINLGTKCRVF